MAEVTSLCVYCGSSSGKHPEYAEQARAFGAEMARREITLVYGGGNVGLMGVVADAVLAGGGKVIGVIPRQLVDREVAHAGLTELQVVDTMHQRKTRMFELSDAFVALPGGFGTLDELFEVLTLVQTQRIPQFPLILFGKAHWKGLIAWLKLRLEKGNLISPDDLDLLKITDDVDEVIAIIRDYERRVGPPGTLPVAFA